MKPKRSAEIKAAHHKSVVTQTQARRMQIEGRVESVPSDYPRLSSTADFRRKVSFSANEDRRQRLEVERGWWDD